MMVKSPEKKHLPIEHHRNGRIQRSAFSDAASAAKATAKDSLRSAALLRTQTVSG